MEGHKIFAIFLAFILFLDFADAAPAPKGMGKNTRLAGRKGKGSNRNNSRNRYSQAGTNNGPQGAVLDPKNAPCIGICFHNKLMALEAETAGGNEVPDANELDFSRGWPLNGAEFEKPCVGVCQYFRENNMVNPFITPKPIVMAET